MAGESGPSRTHTVNPLADPEERRVLYAAIDSFRQYRRAAHYNITHFRRQSFYSLPSAHMDVLCEPPFSLPRTFDAVEKAIDSNADIAEVILATGLSTFRTHLGDDAWQGEATPSDMDKACSTIRQLYRDWSREGLPERQASYSATISALIEHLPAWPVAQRHRLRVLVPGAGLGRLVFDLCEAGYTVEGNEISYHQLMASNYVLNYTHTAGQHKLYPWALNFNNHLTRANQLQAVEVPDVHPRATLADQQSEVLFSERMSMTAGDFCELYRRPEYQGVFDAVTTFFFIDTAPNVISYIETIEHCLKAHGIWINSGPLLWHFEAAPTPAEKQHQVVPNGDTNPSAPVAPRRNAGIGEPGSFELSNDELVALIERLGFDMVEQSQAPGGATGYIQDSSSMLQNVYKPVFWVARKR